MDLTRHPRCYACEALAPLGTKATEWDYNLLHDLQSSGVSSTALLSRVVGQILDLRIKVEEIHRLLAQRAVAVQTLQGIAENALPLDRANIEGVIATMED